MAAGGNLIGGPASAAVLHGARGLTNAIGAIADVRRSETSLLCLVGLPSTSSAPYLPPHAEVDLMSRAGAFAKATFDCSVKSVYDPRWFISQVWAAAAAVVDLAPAGPVLLGLPQDVLCANFVPAELLDDTPATEVRPVMHDIAAAAALIRAAERPVVLVDDFLLRSAGAELDLAFLVTQVGAPVMQVAYRRGPMFFQQIRPSRVPTFRGLYDPENEQQRRLLETADLLITVEDRNMYPRVVGNLPGCKKIAVTSNYPFTEKNGYLQSSDILLIGDAQDILRQLAGCLANVRESSTANAWAVEQEVGGGARFISSEPDGLNEMAVGLARAVARGLAVAPRPVLVDDSQTFGGLMALNYSHLPLSVRVFGSHGGFVGNGLAKGAGLALVHPDVSVVAILGDQGFINGVQALAALREQQAPLLVLVCNNGSSMSLTLQAAADAVGDAVVPTLANARGKSCAAIARGFGLSVSTFSWPGGESDQGLAEVSRTLTAHIASILSNGKLHVLELITPAEPVFWKGIWRLSGQEES